MSTNSHQTSHYTDEEVLAATGMHSPTQLLRVHRLRFWRRLIIAGPAALWALLKSEDEVSEHAFLGRIRADLAWLAEVRPDRVPEADKWAIQEDSAAWVAGCRGWKSLIKGADYLHTKREQILTRTSSWSRDFESLAESAGIAWRNEAPLLDPCKGFHCHLCNKSFPDKRRFAVHNWIKHRTRRIERYFARGTSCMICHKEYHTRTRYVAHLATTRSGCLQATQALLQPWSQADLEKIEKTEATKLREEMHKGRK